MSFLSFCFPKFISNIVSDTLHKQFMLYHKKYNIFQLFQICDKNWAARIKVEKFRSHNQQWLEMVESTGADSTTHILPDDDDSLSPFISGDLLKHTILFPSGNNFFCKHYMQCLLYFSSKLLFFFFL